MKQSKISLCLVVCLVITACSEKAPVNNFYNSTVTTSGENLKLTVDSQKNVSLDSWKKLVLNKEKNNYALAKLFASQVAEADREAVEQYINENISNEDVENIIAKVSANFQNRKNALLFHQAPWASDSELIKKSLLSSDELQINDSDYFEKQLILETSIKIRNQFLENILQTYAENLEKNAEELSGFFAEEIQKNDPVVATAIEANVSNNKKDAALKKIKEALTKFDYFNQIRKDASITNKEVVIAGVAGAISYKIYEKLKDTKTFRDIKKIIAEVKVIKEKFDKSKKIVKAISDIHENTVQNLRDFKNATNELNKNTAGLLEEVSKDAVRNPSTNATFKDQIKILYNKLYKNKDAAKTPSDQLKKYENYVNNIDQSLLKMSDSFSNITANFDSVLENTVALTKTLGIKLGKDAQKVLKSAQTVSKIMNVASNTFKGFVTGGYVGAASTFMGSMGQMFGGNSEGAGMAALSKQLEMMDKKLDEILSLQKQMVQLQLDTMKMIRDLALMVDELHQKEMREIAQLRDDVWVSVEIGKSLLNKDIRKCESLIEFQLTKLNGSTQPYAFKLYDADLIDLTHKDFYGNLKKFQSFQSIVHATHFNGFSDCQSGINEAFGNLSLEENPVLAIYSSGENENLLTFQKNIYLPLLNETYKMMNEGHTIQFPLHLPMKDMVSLDYKSAVMKRPVATSLEQKEVYALEHLISPLALTRYASSLLVLYPLLDFDRDSWEKGPEAIINSFFSEVFGDEDYSETNQFQLNKKIRSLYLLRNALFLTQSSIAQEAILAGEPVLDKIYEQRESIFNTETNCRLNQPSLACSVLKNRLLLKNYILYSVYKTQKAEAYKDALAAEDISALEMVMNDGTTFFTKKIQKQGKNFYLKLDTAGETVVLLPGAEQVDSKKLLYSENMIKLLKLQDKLINAILTVSPQFMFDGLDKQYSALLLKTEGL